MPTSRNWRTGVVMREGGVEGKQEQRLETIGKQSTRHDSELRFVNFRVVSILLLLLNFGIYFNSLSNDFAFDDFLGIVHNADVNSQKIPFQDIFRHDLWGKSLLNVDSHRWQMCILPFDTLPIQRKALSLSPYLLSDLIGPYLLPYLERFMNGLEWILHPYEPSPLLRILAALYKYFFYRWWSLITTD